MAENTTTIQVNIQFVERVRKTDLGNARYILHTDQGDFRTKPNCPIVYHISTLMSGDYTLTLDSLRRVIDFEPRS